MKFAYLHSPALKNFTFIILYTIIIASACNTHYSEGEKDKTNNISEIFSSYSFNGNAHAIKKIYLTFDDGPGEGTENVLKISEDEKVPVTFFVVGEHVFASNRQTQILDELKTSRYIQLCNHGYTHAWHNHYNKFYKNLGLVINDFERTKDSLIFTNSIIRTPGRNIWREDNLRNTDIKKSAKAADALQQAGFTLIGWDLEWRFNKSGNPTVSADSLIKEIDHSFAKNKTRKVDNMVLLAHDRMFCRSSDSLQLRQLFQKLKLRKDYKLAWITSYPYADEKPGRLQAKMPSKLPEGIARSYTSVF